MMPQPSANAGSPALTNQSIDAAASEAAGPAGLTPSVAGHRAGTVRSTARPSALPHRVPMPAPPVIRVLPGVPQSATAAREMTRRLLGDGHPTADTAMLLVSELVANSVLHSQSRRPGGTVTVAVCAGPASVLIQVRDDGGPLQPRLPAAGGTAESAGGAEHGYGLLLVDALAETWGTTATTEGRVTWCRLAVDQRECDAALRSLGLASLPAKAAVSEHRSEARNGEDEDERHGDRDEDNLDREPGRSLRDSHR
jgi:serine/threonine-protein kinase RsbW